MIKINKIIMLHLTLMGTFATGVLSESSSNDKPTYVIGHLIPDTDSIAAAIAAADLFDAVAARTGELNQETQYVLERFNLKVPELRTKFDGANVILVDHNQKSQRPPEFDGNIIRIIDHHAINFENEKPIDAGFFPVGSTCTVLAKMYKDRNETPDKNIAGGLLGGILSDTLNLRSPTTTRLDSQMASWMARIANVSDTDAMTEKMFKLKSDISGKTDEQVLSTDLKEFEIGGKKVAIGVFETLYPDPVFERKEELLSGAKVLKTRNKYDLLFFFIINIHDQDSELLVIGDDEKAIAEKAFKAVGKTKDNILYTGSRISRKLQIVPELTPVIEKQ